MSDGDGGLSSAVQDPKLPTVEGLEELDSHTGLDPDQLSNDYFRQYVFFGKRV